jgi:HEXXH motif-containing protein
VQTRSTTEEVPRYVLTAADFGSLASGYGDASAIRTLVEGQAAKSRLLIRAVVDRVRDSGRGPGALIDAALAVLTDAEARAPGVVRAVLTAPHVTAWALRRLAEPAAGGTAVVGELTLLAAGAAMRARRAFRLDAPSPDGQLVLPTLGVVTGLGAGTVRIEGDPDSVRCTGADGAVRVAAPFTAERPGWLPLRRLGKAGQAHQAVIDDLDPHRDCYLWSPSERLTPPQASDLRRLWDAAWQVLAEEYPRHAATIGATLRALVPLAGPAGAPPVSAASRNAFGAIAVSLPDTVPLLVELLIHEGQHLKLAALLDLVDLYHPAGPAVHYAPWRADPRPVGAILQGTYAQLGVADFWRVRRRALHGAQRAAAEFEFALWRAFVADGLASLRASAELTDLGSRFTGAMADTLGSWESEPVAGAAHRLALDVALAHRAGWAIANRAVAPVHARRMADAWRHGAAVPHVATEVRPASGGGPARSRLAASVRASLCGAAVTGPDACVIAGAYGDAARRYARAIRDAGGVDDWAGLAVALWRTGAPAADRVELARAVYAELSGAGGTVDLVSVARWITGRQRD